MATKFDEAVAFAAPVRFGSQVSGLSRLALQTERLTPYPIPFTAWRKPADLAVPLPATAGSGFLALASGTPGTDFARLQTDDVKASTTTRSAAALLQLAPEYVAAGAARVRLRAGMKTTIADATATLDCSLWAADEEGLVGSDLIATAAQSINSLVVAPLDFNVDASGLAPGAALWLQVSIAIVDAATATAVIGQLTAASLLLDIQG